MYDTETLSIQGIAEKLVRNDVYCNISQHVSRLAASPDADAATINPQGNSEGGMITIGVDPGNTGAIAALRETGEIFDVHDMPLMANGKKQQVNAAEVAAIIRSLRAESERLPVAYIEKVGAMPGQGVSSMFNFGMGFGVLQGVFAACGIPYFLVTPNS